MKIITLVLFLAVIGVAYQWYTHQPTTRPALVGPGDWLSLKNDVEEVRRRTSGQRMVWGGFGDLGELVYRGTIQDYLAAFPHNKPEHYWMGGRGMIYSSPKAPFYVFVMVQVKSIQGNDLVLGPISFPKRYSNVQEAMQAWTVADLGVAFDEDKHFAGMFSPYQGPPGEWTLAVLERGADRPRVAEYIFYRKGAVPNMQTAADVPIPKRIGDALTEDLRKSLALWRKIIEGIQSLF